MRFSYRYNGSEGAKAGTGVQLKSRRLKRRDPEVGGLVDLVARRHHIPMQLMLRRTRGRAEVARARHIAMYLAHVVLGRNLSEVAELFGRDRTTVSYAVAKIEDLRDRARFDSEIGALEDALSGLGRAVVCADRAMGAVNG